MNAKALVRIHGHQLIGKKVFTEKIGDWPGGDAEVIALDPDADGAPEIVFQVRHLTFPGNEKCEREIGVFEWEEVQLLIDSPAR